MNVTASQPIHAWRKATASAATPATTAIAGTKASPASVSLTMIPGSPRVIPAPSPLPRPAKNISTADPISADATAVHNHRHRDTAPARTASPSPDCSSPHTRMTAVTTYAVAAAARNCVIVVYTPSLPCASSTLAISSLSLAASSNDLVMEPKAKPPRNIPTVQPTVWPRCSVRCRPSTLVIGRAFGRSPDDGMFPASY